MSVARARSSVGVELGHLFDDERLGRSVAGQFGPHPQVAGHAAVDADEIGGLRPGRQFADGSQPTTAEPGAEESISLAFNDDTDSMAPDWLLAAVEIAHGGTAPQEN